MERALLGIVSAYLLGSVPVAYLVTRWRTGQDIRYLGDGNVGARNVFHMVGARWGVLVALLDMGKGCAAYTLTRWLSCPFWSVLVVGFVVGLGHAFPLFLRGQGGKSVAVTIGFLFGFLPLFTLAGAGLFGLAYLLKRDFNKALVAGVAAMLLLLSLFGYGLGLSFYVLALFLAMAAKKALDLPRERAVWARNPWRDGTGPDWYPGSAERPPADVPESISPLPH